MIVTLPFLRATWWIRLRGSASDICVASSLTPAILRLSMLCGFVVLSSLSPSVMLGFATCLGTTRPGRRPTMDREIGYIPCQASGPTPCLTLSFGGVSNKDLVSMPQGLVNLVVARPQGASDATTYLTRWADMLASATKGYTHADMTVCVTTLPLWPTRRHSQYRLRKTCLYRVRP